MGSGKKVSEVQSHGKVHRCKIPRKIVTVEDQSPVFLFFCLFVCFLPKLDIIQLYRYSDFSQVAAMLKGGLHIPTPQSQMTSG